MATKTDQLTTAVVVALTLCAATLTGLNVRRAFFPPSWSLTQPADTIQEWSSFASGGHRLGSHSARVTAVVFSDYQCPYCRVLEVQLSLLRKQYPDEFAVVWRHSPWEGHSLALTAARAAVCAAEQGRFELVNRALFDAIDEDSPAAVPWATVVANAGVADTVTFLKCLWSDRSRAALEGDFEAARRLRIVATPTFLINEYLYTGVPDDLTRIVRREVKVRALSGS